MFVSRVVVLAADPGISPNNAGLPGLSVLKQIVGALLTWGLVACVAGLVVSVIVWALGHHGGNYSHTSNGKTGVLVTPDDPTDLARGICDLLRDPARARALGKAGRQHVLRTATLSKTAADLDRLYRQWLFKGGRRKMGHRPWVTRLRYPGMVLTWLYINTRLERIEFGLIRKWMAGWRPWHEIYTPHVRQAAASAATASLHARDAVSASTLPVRLFASSWIGRFRRGEVRMNKPTLRLLALDLIAMQPPKLRTFMYESIARYRGATRDRG